MLVSREPDLFRLAVTLNAGATDAWNVLTAPAGLARWWGGHVTLDTFAGGHLREQWTEGDRTVTTVGRIVVCEPPHVIAFTWADDDWMAVTGVSWQLVNVAEAPSPRCELHLEHRGWLALPDDRRESLMQAHIDGWSTHLSRLAAVLNG
ncbi:SRPBCC domain-containing protein [Gemmatimonas sp.]|uniref:SRPBCC family protein n=1 Tax=Gemmatimonas sp. TaxID=1962908 RepID=UPI00286A76B2|nr:SRPBCC domain-containing protein [Gemmatimonas sp.]